MGLAFLRIALYLVLKYLTASQSEHYGECNCVKYRNACVGRTVPHTSVLNLSAQSRKYSEDKYSEEQTVMNRVKAQARDVAQKTKALSFLQAYPPRGLRILWQDYRGAHVRAIALRCHH
jgi:hypothetical protein